jgi:hypothetical protein
MTMTAQKRTHNNRSDKWYVRATSNALKAVGFRYGAPLYRAEADFTIDQAFQGLRRGLRHHSSVKLNFETRGERASIQMHLTAIRACDLTCSRQFVQSLFPEYPWLDWCFMLEGLLVTPVDGDDFATSEAYDPGESPSLDEAGLLDDEDFYLKVLAVVACDHEGRVLDAIVQKVPSPADELLYIPQL